MKYNRFEELPVWKDAIELAVNVFALTSRSQYRPYRSVRDQIERAAMSVSQIKSRRNFAPTASLVQLTPKLRHSRTALLE